MPVTTINARQRLNDVGGGGGGGPIVIDDITDAGTVGKDVLSAPDQAYLLNLIGLATSLVPGLFSPTQKAQLAALVAGGGGGGGPIVMTDITDSGSMGRDVLGTVDRPTLLDLLGIPPDVLDSSAVGLSMLTAADQDAQTALIALATTLLPGLLSSADKTTINGLAAMATTPTAANITDASAVGRSMLTAADQAAQTNLIALATGLLSGLMSSADKAKVDGLATLATTPTAANITDASAVGRSMLTAASQAAQTALIALATTALNGLLSAADKTKLDGLAAMATTATAANITDATADGRNMLKAASVPAQRTLLGLASIATNPISNNISDSTSFGRGMIQGSSASGTALLDAATTVLPGLLAAADKVKLNGLATLATTPTAANITDASAVGRSMLTAASQAVQTALIALATTSLAGLMSALDKTKLDQGQVLIANATLSGSSYTSPTWTANAYRKIRIEVDGSISAFSYLRLQMNADSGAKYWDIGIDNNTATSNDASSTGANGYARLAVGVSNNMALDCVAELFPVTDGFPRTGMAQGAGFLGGQTSLNSHHQRLVSFGYDDTATNITFITLSVGSTFAGNVKIYGVPA